MASRGMRQFKKFTHNIRSTWRNLLHRTTFIYRVRYVLIISFFMVVFCGTAFVVAKSLGVFESKQKMNLDLETAFFFVDQGEYIYNMGLDGLVPSDDDYEYTFTVSNFDDKEVSNVDLSYEIRLLTTTNLPLSYKLYIEEGNSNLLTDKMLKQDEDGSWYNLYKSRSRVLFNKGQRRTDTYHLKVTFPKSYSLESKYAEQIESVQIIINARQLIGDETI